MSQAVLQKLLRDGIRFQPLYRPSFNSDHLPMALAAMHGLGADDESLQGFRDDYVPRLQTWDPVEPIDQWRASLGDRSAYPALLKYFSSQLKEQGAHTLLIEVLPTTLPGIALDAFHPMIRLGFGVEFETDEEIAAGLAYMVSAHHDMPVDERTIDLRRMLEQQTLAGPVPLEANRFSAALDELVEKDRYPVGSASDLTEIAGVALDVYLATRNFFALHLVTSTQALRSVTLNPSITPELKTLAVASMTGALLASHLVLRSPSIGSVLAVPSQLDPEHAIKYVWSCLAEYRACGDARYMDEIRAFRDAGLVPSWAARDLLDQAD